MRLSIRPLAAGLLALGLGLSLAPASASESEADDGAAALEPSGPADASAAVAERQTLLRAKLATALAQLAPIKTMMTEHYLVNGEWPASPADVGLDAAELTSSVIAGVSFELGGVIVARLTSEVGDYSVLRLVPQPVMGGTSLEWRCRANLSAALLRMLPCTPEP